MNLPRATSEPAERSKLEIFERSLASWASPQKRRVRDPAPQHLQVKPATGHMVSMALVFQAFDALKAKYPNAFDRFVVPAKAPDSSVLRARRSHPDSHLQRVKQTTMLYDMCTANAPYTPFYLRLLHI
jgi:hypothetical protein